MSLIVRDDCGFKEELTRTQGEFREITFLESRFGFEKTLKAIAFSVPQKNHSRSLFLATHMTTPQGTVLVVGRISGKILNLQRQGLFLERLIHEFFTQRSIPYQIEERRFRHPSFVRLSNEDIRTMLKKHYTSGGSLAAALDKIQLIGDSETVERATIAACKMHDDLRRVKTVFVALHKQRDIPQAQRLAEKIQDEKIKDRVVFLINKEKRDSDDGKVQQALSSFRKGNIEEALQVARSIKDIGLQKRILNPILQQQICDSRNEVEAMGFLDAQEFLRAEEHAQQIWDRTLRERVLEEIEKRFIF